jgi:hypothetical protein
MMVLSAMEQKHAKVELANRGMVIPVHQVHHAMKKRMYATAL